MYSIFEGVSRQYRKGKQDTVASEFEKPEKFTTFTLVFVHVCTAVVLVLGMKHGYVSHLSSTQCNMRERAHPKAVT
jgi:hypothetical protein